MVNIAKPIIGEEEKKAVMAVLDSGMLAQGEQVKQLEEQFAKLCGTKHAIAVNSGTAALHAALYALGVKEGDEVITTPFTFVATSNCILMQGAKPVFADIDEKTFNLNPVKTEEKITPNTKAIIPVDLFGQIYNAEQMNEIAERYGLKILEDACQAVGAELNGKKAGSFGDMAAFSLYATKNMMSGEGGIITTDKDEYAEKARRFRHHGQTATYEYAELGYNYRMTNIQAAIALEQLKKIEKFNQKRIQNAKILTEGLAGVKGITTPYIKPGAKHVFHQYTILVGQEYGKTRDELVQALKAADIGTGIFYPKPLHLHPVYAKYGYKEGDFPVAEKLAKQVLSLPVHPSVTDEDLKSMIKVIKG